MKTGDIVFHEYYGEGKICQWPDNQWVGVIFNAKELTRSGDGYVTCKREEIKLI
jgi:hypothetical protein